jgi:DNA-binding CsgD family transcriptional regulator
MERKMDDLLSLILDKVPVGIILVDQDTKIVYSNRQAANFLKRYELPEEIITISRRIFDAILTSRIHALFPGEIYLVKGVAGSASKWTFKFFIREDPKPLIGIFIMEETISHTLDMNEIRKQFKLTRRETDVLRRVLDGLKNLEIAGDLEISEQTVKDHLSNIYMKLGVENRFALIRSLVHTLEQ